MKTFKTILNLLGASGFLISVQGFSGTPELETVLKENRACRISGLAQVASHGTGGERRVSGTRDSICIQAKNLNALTGIKADGSAVHLALIGPDGDDLGQVKSVKAVGKSDIVLVNFEVQNVYGVGGKLHVFGGRIHNLKGVFDEIHLYDDAVIESISEIKGGIRY